MRGRCGPGPIDGTINFAHGSPLCAISLALLTDGVPTLAVVDLPLLGEHYVAAEGAGAYRNGRRIHVSEVNRLAEAVIALTDFPSGSAAGTENAIQLALIEALASQALRVRMHGSEALDLAWVACGRLDAALMLSSLPWDVSGGVLLVREAGGAVYDAGGREQVASSGSACLDPGAQGTHP